MDEEREEMKRQVDELLQQVDPEHVSEGRWRQGWWRYC